MRRSFVMHWVLAVSLSFIVFAALPDGVPNPALSRAEAGPKAIERRALRHAERNLKRKEHHQERQIKREKRQGAGIKRVALKGLRSKR